LDDYAPCWTFFVFSRQNDGWVYDDGFAGGDGGISSPFAAITIANYRRFAPLILASYVGLRLQIAPGGRHSRSDNVRL